MRQILVKKRLLSAANRIWNVPYCFIMVFIMFACTLKYSYSQDDPDAEPPPDPKVVNAGTMGLSNTNNGSIFAGNEGVDYYTGSATYSIPINTLKSYSLSTQVGLGYSSNGIRVDELSGPVGMGWSLNHGGVIKREIQGYPDEYENKGFWYHGDDANLFLGTTNVKEQTGIIDDILNDKNINYDTEPDIFHFNFGNFSGKFFIDCNSRNRRKLISPYQDLEILEIVENNKIIGFEIIDLKGIKYIFGKVNTAIEETKISNLKAVIKYKYWEEAWGPYMEWDDMGEEYLINEYFNSAWYLTRIESPDDDYINFEYDENPEASYVDPPVISRTQIEPIEWGFCFSREPNKNDYPLYPKYYDLLDDVTNSTCDGIHFNSCCPERYELGEWQPLYNTLYNPFQYTLSYTYNDVRRKSISKISTKSGKSLVFSKQYPVGNYGFSQITGVAYLINDEIQMSYRLNYSHILSATYEKFGYQVDPMNEFEYLLFNNLEISQFDDQRIPASVLSDHFSDYSKEKSALVEKYFFTGLKRFNYERYFLNSFTIKGNDLNIHNYTFTYQQPEKLPRRTTPWKNIYGFTITDRTDPYSIFRRGKEDNCYKDDGDIMFPPEDNKPEYWEPNKFQVTDGVEYHVLNPTIGFYGCLNSVQLPTGGLINYSYGIYDYCKCGQMVGSIKYFIDNGNTLAYSKYINYPDGFYVSPSDPDLDFDYYNFRTLKHITTTLISSANLMPFKLTKGSYIGFKSAYIRTKSNYSEKFNGFEKYYFTTPPTNPDVHTYSYPEYLGSITSTYKTERITCTKFMSYCKKDIDFSQQFNKLSYKYPYGKDFSDTENDGAVRTYLSGIAGETRNEDITKKSITYTYSSQLMKQFTGLKCTKFDFAQYVHEGEYNPIACSWGGETYYRVDIWDIEKYMASILNYSSRKFELTKKVETIKNSHNNENITIETDYKYTNGLPSEILTTQSDGTKTKKYIKYVSDLVPDDNCYTTFNQCTSNLINTIECVNQTCPECKHDVQTPTCISCWGNCEQNYLAGQEICDQGLDACLAGRNDDLKAIIQLVDNKQIAYPVEEQIYRVKDGVEYLIGGSYTKYKAFDNNIIKPSETHVIHLSQPVEGDQTAKINSSGDLELSQHYKAEQFIDAYDAYGHALQSHKLNSKPESYIFGYNNTLPIAKVSNAEYDEIFVENFDCTIDELKEKSWWNGNAWSGITTSEYEGRSCLQINEAEWLFAPIIGVKPGSKYIVSAKVKKDMNNAGIKAQIGTSFIGSKVLQVNGEWCWLTFTCEIPVGYNGDPGFGVYISNDDAGTVYFDELRVFPADAQMTSYTYKPLVGMTSQTDANGLTTYYEYDDLGRLLVTRDDDYNIVQAQEYHYKNETVTGGISIESNDCYLKFECNVSGGSNSFSYLWEIVSDNHCGLNVSANYFNYFGISVDTNDDTCNFIFDIQCTVTDLVTGKEYIYTISAPYYCN